MKRKSDLILAVLLAVFLALGAIVGQQLTRAREAEQFYRWIISYATAYRVNPEGQEDSEDAKMMDRPLFESVSTAVEPLLPAPNRALTEDDNDKQGKPYSKLILAVKDTGHEKAIYDLASGAALGKERAEFLSYLRDKKIGGMGTAMNMDELYSSGAGVNLGSLFFGFRTMAANLVWLQLDKYWHKGEMFRMYPLMKTCVMLDPHFIDAFLLGAWHLSYNIPAGMPDTPEPQKEFDPIHKVRVGPKEMNYYRAIDFLKDGIRKNPKNYKLYFDLGYAIYDLKLSDYSNSVKYLSEAIRHKHDQWVPRMLYHSLQLNGQFEDALAGWQDYKAKFPESSVDVVRRSILTNQGLIKERDGDEALAYAKDLARDAETARQKAEQARKAASDARTANNETEAQQQDALAQQAEAEAAAIDAKAQDAKAQADQSYSEARAIWEEMNKGEGDPFAFGRLARMDARKMIEDKQYHEAIGLLEYARYQSNQFFNEASDMIIEAKQKGGIKLNLSERMELARREEASKFVATEPKTIGNRLFEYHDGVWVEDQYQGEGAVPFAPSADQHNEFRKKYPYLDQILALNPRVIFQLGGTWFDRRTDSGTLEAQPSS